MTSSLNLKKKYPGVLFLVVGPSGVGKDSLIDGAKAARITGFISEKLSDLRTLLL